MARWEAQNVPREGRQNIPWGECRKMGKTGKIEKTSKNIDNIAQIGGKSRKRLGFPHISVFFGDFTCAFLQASLGFPCFPDFPGFSSGKHARPSWGSKCASGRSAGLFFNYSYYFQDFVFRAACTVLLIITTISNNIVSGGVRGYFK